MDSRTFFDALAAHWDDNYQPGLRGRCRATELAGVYQGCRMLDIACGTGVMFPELLAAGAGEILGVDIAPQMIKLAQEKFAHEPRIQLLCANILTFAPAEKFDAILLFNAYPHFLDKPALLAKAAALLRPGGRFTVCHDMGWQRLNLHHHTVPPEIAMPLGPAREEAKTWQRYFLVDRLYDEADFYLISGQPLLDADSQV